jgi:hypothetical protein
MIGLKSGDLSAKFRAMQRQRALAVLVGVLSCIGSARPVIVEIKKVRNRTITCMHTGLMSDLNDCGVRSDWYTYVFVGSITAINPTGKDEKNIQIIPEEVFQGAPPTPLTVVTSQGLCLPEMALGGRWLFFLRKEKGKPIVLDYYGNDSRPVAMADDQIETLRRLKAIGDRGILRGRVMRGPSYSKKDAVPEVRVVARRASDNAQFVATTDTDGRYEFQPIPPGKYKLTVDRIGSFHADDSEIDVSRGACWDLTLTRSPHAQLGGYVQHPDGSAAAEVPVIIIAEDNSWFTTETSDARGRFHLDSLQAGKYVVGINLPGAPAWKYAGCGGACEIPPASLYYPGVTNRSAALTIILATDEKRDNIDFNVPNQ